MTLKRVLSCWSHHLLFGSTLRWAKFRLVVELRLKTYFGRHGGGGGEILTALNEKNEFARSSCHQVQINTKEKNDETTKNTVSFSFYKKMQGHDMVLQVLLLRRLQPLF